MKFFPLIWAGLWRKPLRTSLTFLAIMMAFLLFGALQGISKAIDQLVAGSHVDRLYVMSRYNENGDIALPIAQLSRIQEVAGVAHVVPLDGMLGYFQDPQNFVFGWAADPNTFFDVYSELKIPADQLARWQQMRTGAVAGSGAAAKYGWKVGDRVPIRSITPRKDGSNDWAFDIVGIYDEPNAKSITGLSTRLVVNYAYFDEARAARNGGVFAFVVGVTDPAAGPSVAAAIDQLFANSSDETETKSEQDFAATILSQLGNIQFFVQTIILAAFFTLLFVTGSTAAQSMRERLGELAVLKTIGFSDVAVQGIIVAESLVLCITAASLALAIVWGLFPQLKLFNGVGQPLGVEVLAWGLLAAVILAVATVAGPARRAGRLTIIEALAES